jgi:hypothetical protein
MSDQVHLIINRKIVVVGYRQIAPKEFEPDFYIAKLAVTKEQADPETLFFKAEREARNKGGLAGNNLASFFEEDFAKIRNFYEKFQALDRQEVNHHHLIEKPGIYHGSWEMSVEAQNPLDAARQMRKMFDEPGESVVFTIRPDNHDEQPVYVDLNVSMENETDEESNDEFSISTSLLS